jgi:uncharacterized coiled-coil DUF342 family protein
MTNKSSTEPRLQLTISLADVEQLRSENESLKTEAAELHTKVASLQKQLQNIHSSRFLPKVITKRDR